MEFLKFIFSSFYVWLGFIIILIVAGAILNTVLDFIVEMFYGKPPVTNNYYDGKKSDTKRN
jgi:hypothetical protein